MNAFIFYKISNYFYKKNMKKIAKLIVLINFFIFRAYIPYEIEVGKNFKLGYGGLGIILNKKSKIGDNVFIAHQVTLGGGGSPNNIGAPILKNNIYIGSGAKILGDVIIEDNVVVGANAVITKNIPSNSVVVGANRIIKQNIDINEYMPPVMLKKMMD